MKRGYYKNGRYIKLKKGGKVSSKAKKVPKFQTGTPKDAISGATFDVATDTVNIPDTNYVMTNSAGRFMNPKAARAKDEELISTLSDADKAKTELPEERGILIDNHDGGYEYFKGKNVNGVPQYYTRRRGTKGGWTNVSNLAANDSDRYEDSRVAIEKLFDEQNTSEASVGGRKSIHQAQDEAQMLERETAELEKMQQLANLEWTDKAGLSIPQAPPMPDKARITTEPIVDEEGNVLGYRPKQELSDISAMSDIPYGMVEDFNVAPIARGFRDQMGRDYLQEKVGEQLGERNIDVSEFTHPDGQNDLLEFIAGTGGGIPMSTKSLSRMHKALGQEKITPENLIELGKSREARRLGRKARRQYGKEHGRSGTFGALRKDLQSLLKSSGIEFSDEFYNNDLGNIDDPQSGIMDTRDISRLYGALMLLNQAKQQGVDESKMQGGYLASNSPILNNNTYLFKKGGNMKAKTESYQGGGMADPAMAGGAPPQGPPPEAAGGGGDPMQALVQGAMQAVETQDPSIALQVCQMLVEMVGGAGQPTAEGQPVMARGGKLYMKKGGKMYSKVKASKKKKAKTAFSKGGAPKIKYKLGNNDRPEHMR